MKLLRQTLISAIMAVLPIAATADDTLLTLSGVQAPVTYDRAALEELRVETIQTTTIWTEGTQEFTGVPLAAFVEAAGITSGTLKAYAVNDYAVEIPVSDAVQNGPIIAYLNNGEPMSIRDKGPLWIIYPYDSKPEYQSEIIYSRSIWQLDRIELK